MCCYCAHLVAPCDPYCVFCAAQGAGSGASESLEWQHAVFPGDADSVALIQDYWAHSDEQQLQMVAAMNELVRLGKARCAVEFKPASLLSMRSAIDYETVEVDEMDGTGRTIGYYW